MRRPLSALLVLTLLATVAGCGSDAKRNNGYVRQLNAAQTSFATAATRISRAVTTGSSVRQDRRTLERYQVAIQRVIATLRGIDVPGDVQADHARLVAAMTDFRTDIRSASAALGEPTRSRLDEAQATLTRALPRLNSRIRAAATAINTKLGTTGS